MLTRTSATVTIIKSRTNDHKRPANSGLAPAGNISARPLYISFACFAPRHFPTKENHWQNPDPFSLSGLSASKADRQKQNRGQTCTKSGAAVFFSLTVGHF
jgi:hypothetical protein